MKSIVCLSAAIVMAACFAGTAKAQPPAATVAASVATAPVGPGTPLTVALSVSGSAPSVSGFVFKIGYNDAQVALVDVTDNTGQPLADAYYSIGAKVPAALSPATNCYQPVELDTALSLGLPTNVALLHFLTAPSYAGKVNIHLEDLSANNGLFDDDGFSITHDFSVPDPLVEDPQITSVTPEYIVAGSPSVTLTVTGLGFKPGAQLLWDGSPRPASYVGPTTLVATVGAADISAARRVGVRVGNVAPVGWSNELPFYVVDYTDIFVRASWGGSPFGTQVEPGRFFGVNAFDTVAGGVAQAADGGSSVTVFAGSYAAEAVGFAKALRFVNDGAPSPTVASFTLSAGAALIGSTGTPAPVMAPVVAVVSDTVDAQDGIDLCAASGVVTLVAGVFPGSLEMLRHDQSLRGVRFGEDARTRVGPETVLSSSAPAGTVRIGATGVTLDGLTVAAGAVDGVRVDGGLAAATVDNVVFAGASSAAIRCGVPGEPSGLSVSRCRAQSCAEGFTGDFTTARLTENLVTSCSASAFSIASGAALATTNTLSYNGIGVQLGAGSALVEGNVISFSAAAGVSVAAAATASLVGNNITTNTVGLASASAVPVAADGNWWGSYRGPGTADFGGRNGNPVTGSVAVTTWTLGQYFTDSFASGITDNLNFDDDRDGWPDFVEEFVIGTDALNPNDPPFHPQPTDIFVDDDWKGSSYGQHVGPGKIFGVNAFAVIQDGVDALPGSGTVHVAAGSYPESVFVDKTCRLEGPRAGTPGWSDLTLAGAARTGPEAVVTGWTTATEVFTLAASGTILDGFTVQLPPEGFGGVNQGVAHVDPATSLTVVNNVILGAGATGVDVNGVSFYNSNMVFDVANNYVADFEQAAVTAGGNGGSVNGASISRNLLSNCGYGVAGYYGGGAVVDNVIAGGTNSFAGIAAQMKGGVAVTGNTVGNLPPDAVGAIAILRASFRPLGPVTVSGNTLQGNARQFTFDATPGTALRVNPGNYNPSTLGTAGLVAVAVANSLDRKVHVTRPDGTLRSEKVDGATVARMNGQIQVSVDAAVSGDTAHVGAGVYAENVDVPKTLSILGPFAGVAGTDPSRGGTGEAVIVPTVDDTTLNLITLHSSNSVVDGLTVDGDNPALSGSFSRHGVSIEAGGGVTNLAPGRLLPVALGLQNLVVRNLAVRNLRYGAVEFEQINGAADVPMTGGSYTRNLVDNAGTGVSLVANVYGQVSDNTIRRTGVGVNAGECQRPGATSLITRNAVEAEETGVCLYQFGDSAFGTGSPFVVTGNTIAESGSAGVSGISLGNFQGAATAAVTANPVTGFLYGVEGWELLGSTPLVIGGCSITNSKLYGVASLDDSPRWGPQTTPGVSRIHLDGVTISGALGAGIGVVDNSAAVPLATRGVHAEVVTTASVIGGGAGALVSGPKATVRVAHTNVTGAGTGVSAVLGGGAEMWRSDITGCAVGFVADSGGAMTTVTENRITGNTGAAVQVTATGSATGRLFNNDLSCNGGLCVTNAAATPLDASGNWYGVATPAGVAARTSAGTVDYTPWLCSGSNQLSSTPGFQGDFSKLYVARACPQTNGLQRIQEGVDLLVGTGLTLYVADGVYGESNTTLNKAMSLIGDSRAGTVVQPAAGDANQASAFGGAFQHGLIVAASDVSVSGLSLNGTPFGSGFRCAIAQDSRTGNFSRTTVDNVSAAGAYYAGILLGGQNAAVDGNAVTNSAVSTVAAGAGIRALSAAATITNNTVSNSAVGLELNASLHSASGNAVSDNTTGVLVTNGAGAVLQGNRVWGGSEALLLTGLGSTVASSSNSYTSASVAGLRLRDGSAIMNADTVTTNGAGVIVEADASLTSATWSYIAGNSVAGFRITKGTANASLNLITANAIGVLVDSGCTLTTAGVSFTRNHIWLNTTSGADNRSTLGTGLNALGCWWGDVTGPLNSVTNKKGKGNQVTSRVEYDPWYDKGRILNDKDGDGVLNAFEDRNLNSIVDSWETRPGSFDPATQATAADRDTDGDGYEDGVEIAYGSNPLDSSNHPPAIQPYALNNTDTDNDGYKDFYEFSHGTDYKKANSKPPLGDVNGDGKVDNADISALLNYYGGSLVPNKPDNADMDRNGVIDNIDVSRLLNFYGGAIKLP